MSTATLTLEQVVPEWSDFLRLRNEELGTWDVATVHLACATDLPSSVPLDVPASRRRLEEWAGTVEGATERFRSSYLDDPGAFHNSWAYFRVLVLVTILQRDLGVRGTDEFNENPRYDDAADWFVHGILAGRPGNCATLPVLTVAVGRRFGYPLVLVRSAYHLFCRWEEPGERFNIECSGTGLETPADEHYLSWPVRTTAEEAAKADFLRSLTPRGELASFLITRGVCLGWHRRYQEAIEALAASCRLHPENTLTLGTINRLLEAWQRDLLSRAHGERPLLTIGNPPLRYLDFPPRIQDRVVYLEAMEAYLSGAQSEQSSPAIVIESENPKRVTVSYP